MPKQLTCRVKTKMECVDVDRDMWHHTYLQYAWHPIFSAPSSTARRVLTRSFRARSKTCSSPASSPASTSPSSSPKRHYPPQPLDRRLRGPAESSYLSYRVTVRHWRVALVY
eukprot:3556562-Rhodomonas_salina.3